MAGFLGKGQVYIDRNMTGGYLPIGNATKFAIAETDADVKERTSRQKDTYGQALDRVALPKPAKITIEMDEIDANNLGIALRGSVESVTSTGSITDESHDAILGKYIKLAHSNVSTVVITDSTGNTTYTEGTDYKVRGSVGLIEILSGGSITDGEALLIDYDYNETSSKIKGSQETEVQAALILEGTNQTNGKDCRVFVYKARMMPTSDVDFLSSDFTTITLEGTLLKPEDKDEPYYVEYVE